MNQNVTSERVYVRFPRQRGFYLVEVNQETQRAVDRLTSNKLGYYELGYSTDEPVLWRYAQFATENIKELARLKVRADLQPQS